MVLSDMNQLLYQGADPDDRVGLRPKEEAGHMHSGIDA